MGHLIESVCQKSFLLVFPRGPQEKDLVGVGVWNDQARVYVDLGVPSESNGSTHVFGEIYGRAASTPEDHVGVFAYVSVLDDEVRVGTDYFGMEVIYEFRSDSFFAVSNSLYKIVRFCSDRETIYFDEFFLRCFNFLSPNSVQQPLTDNLPLRGLRRLPPGAVVKVSMAGGWSVEVQPDSEAGSSGTGPAYEDLLEAGIRDVRENIQYMADTIKGHINMDLSGGKDSRMVLAAALSIPGLSKNIRLNIKSTPNEVDKIYSLAIAQAFSLGFSVNSTKAGLPLPLDSLVDFFFDCYFNESANIGFPSKSQLGEGQPQVFLTGGCGELVTRTANVRWLRTNPLLKDVQCDISELVAASLLRHRRLFLPRPDDAHDRYLALYFDDAYTCFPRSGCVLSDLQHFYARYRNRVHFGMRTHSEYHGTRSYFPLLSVNLYRASGLLGPEERQSGRLIYDFIKFTTPELLNFSFASDFPYWKTQHADVLIRQVDVLDPSYKTIEREWRAARETPVGGGGIPDDLRWTMEGLDLVLMDRFVDALRKLKSIDYSGHINEKLFMDYLKGLVHKNKKQAFSVMTHAIGLASYVDFVNLNTRRLRFQRGG